MVIVMNCPGCGRRIEEGYLYCDSCGEEIRIVPDFEPEIEKEMDDTLSALFRDIHEEAEEPWNKEEEKFSEIEELVRIEQPFQREEFSQAEELFEREELLYEDVTGREEVPEIGEFSEPEDFLKREDFLEGEVEEKVLKRDGARKTEKKSGRGKPYFIAVCLLIFSLLISIGVYQSYSASYQVGRAEKAAASGKYTQAISYLEKAHDLKKEDAAILFLMADYYCLQEKEDTALHILQEIIEREEEYGEVEVENAYNQSIAIYKEAGNYSAINELLASCKQEAIVNRFQQYIAKTPEFSYVGGSYKEVLPLKLSANTAGTIYYTLDGSIPSEESTVYTAPIFLETGTCTVTAYFINDYGIESDMVSHTYTIDLPEPSAPEVSVYSGEYQEPRMIAASAPEDCRIYYTMDGTLPGVDSFAYTAPIPMPLGTSIFKFAAISPEGISSPVITRTYTLSLETQITIETAIANVKQALIDANILLSQDGNMWGMNGHNVYKYNAVVSIENRGNYYVIHEYYEDVTGIQTRTERLYGVSLQDGSAWRITYDEEGQVVLAKIE